MLEMETIKHRSLVSLRVARNRANEAATLLQLANPLSKHGTDPASVWLGPAHWLLMSESQSANEIISFCGRRLEGITHNATDASDAYDILNLRGPSVRDLLASGCGLDFRKQSFVQGSCQRTRLARIQVTICLCEEDQFELLLDHSHGTYLRSWLTDSANLLRTSKRGSSATHILTV